MKTLEDTRLYGILDTGYLPAETTAFVDACAQLIAGGVDILQLRAKRESMEKRRELLAAIMPAVREARIPLIINDHIELALEQEETGLHIGQEDLAPQEARQRLGTGRLLGLSTHSVEQARAALSLPPGTLDYFCIGPVFPTGTKPDYQAVGLGTVQEVCRLVQASAGAPPLFAIGGINAQTLPAVCASGVRRVVVVSAMLLATDRRLATRQIRNSLA